MRRYLCTVAAGLLLALAGSGTAAAGDLPILGGTQEGTQSTSFGDQTVEEQKNDAGIEQKQGNDNFNFSPAIALFGDASTWNSQGNGNTAIADVEQENTATQSQSSEQKQELDQDGSGGHCCGGQSQTGEQKVYGGDQTVEEQKNDADIEQKQGNGNVNISPAISIFGDASTWNAQGNGNTAVAKVDQSNTATQTQDASQTQSLEQSGGGGKWGGSCCGGQSQTGEQKVYGGDQTVEEQKNDADIEQKQGNDNENKSLPIAVLGDSSTKNAQGNGNVAGAWVSQSNEATQSQSATQAQDLEQDGPDYGKPDYGKPGYEKPKHPSRPKCGFRCDKPDHFDCKKGDWKGKGHGYGKCHPFEHPTPDPRPCGKPQPRCSDECGKGYRLLV